MGLDERTVIVEDAGAVGAGDTGVMIDEPYGVEGLLQLGRCLGDVVLGCRCVVNDLLGGSSRVIEFAEIGLVGRGMVVWRRAVVGVAARGQWLELGLRG